MFPTMSNSTSLSGDAAIVSSVGTTKLVHDFASLNPLVSSFSPPPHRHSHLPQQNKIKKKRNLPGNPDPDAEVVALSPKTLVATNRFVCEYCNKGFQRDQNLQLHRRGHNLPWKLKQRSSSDVVKKKAYVCPEPSCVHHHPSRALGDLTGIKKHYSRKHGEKKWKCHKCSKIYAVQSDWKAHSKTCGTREYRCDCGTLFSRKGSFITHRAFCEALAEESARLLLSSATNNPNYYHDHHIFDNNSFITQYDPNISLDPHPHTHQNPTLNPDLSPRQWFSQDPPADNGFTLASPFPSVLATVQPVSNSFTSPASTAMAMQQPQYSVDLETTGTAYNNNIGHVGFGTGRIVGRHFKPEFLGMSAWQKSESLTRDFLGLTADNHP